MKIYRANQSPEKEKIFIKSYTTGVANFNKHVINLHNFQNYCDQPKTVL